MIDPRIITLLAAGLALGAGSTWLARETAWRLGVVNHPNTIVVQHTRPIAYLGGAGIALGVAAAVFLAQALWSIPRAGLMRPDLLAGGAFYLVLGLADDLRPFRPLPKFGLQLAGAIGVVYLRTANDGFDPLFAVMSVVWIVTLVNAVNLTDVCDGLVAGLACIQFVALALLVPSTTIWASAIAGSCAGLMLFNAPAASIFLGDAGSHLLGVWLAVLTLDLVVSSRSATSIAQAVLIAGVPLFELIFVSAMRIQKGLPWWQGSPDHFSLRLQSSGFSRWATDSLAWTAMLLLATLAWLLQGLSASGAVALVAGLGLLLVWCWSYLQRCESRR
jgi:UDP-GlcNAc:undecaprenyl-phosphate/decaprenyl-phosphate GlcNAc-1-phosphate transferase